MEEKTKKNLKFIIPTVVLAVFLVVVVIYLLAGPEVFFNDEYDSYTGPLIMQDMPDNSNIQGWGLLVSGKVYFLTNGGVVVTDPEWGDFGSWVTVEGVLEENNGNYYLEVFNIEEQ